MNRENLEDTAGDHLSTTLLQSLVGGAEGLDLEEEKEEGKIGNQSTYFPS